MKYHISNLVYGPFFAELFCNYHLRGLLDPSNLPAIVSECEVEYVIFTDIETRPLIEKHLNFKRLDTMVKTSFVMLKWSNDVDRYSLRHHIRSLQFRESARLALKNKQWLSLFTADLVMAMTYLPQLIHRAKGGCEAVFSCPMRSAFESIVHPLGQVEGALSALELFQAAIDNLHPRWVASHWNAPLFSKMPSTLLWGHGNGLLARSFAATPIIFKVTPPMLDSTSAHNISALCSYTKPCWVLNWLEAPAVFVEPLAIYYPPFQNRPASAADVAAWAKANAHETQIEHLKQFFFYPSRASIPNKLIKVSSTTINRIIDIIRSKA